MLQRALVLHQAGRLQEARAIYLQLLKLAPGNAELSRLLASVEARLGRHQEALRLLDAALALAPNHVDALIGRGNVLLETGNAEGALQSYDRAISARPGDTFAHHNRGLALHELGRFAEALTSLENAVARSPEEAVIHNSCGNTLLSLGRISEALASYGRAIALNPEYPDPFNNRGNALRHAARFDEALRDYDRAIALRPDYVEAHNNRGMVLQQLARFDEALTSLDRAIAMRPDFADAHNNRGNVLQRLGRLAEAIACYDTAIRFKPDHADAYNNRANALQDLDRTTEALADYARALSLRPGHPSACFNKALMLLRRGDYADAWPLYEKRWESSLQAAARHFAQPLWLGDVPIEGKTILLHAEQGLGDTLQFCRYIPMVAARGARVLFEVPRPLLQLLAGLEGAAEVIARGEELPPFDCQCPLMSLPLAFRTTPTTIPTSIPYIRCDARKAAAWHERLSQWSNWRVGLVWSGGHRPDQPELWPVNDRRNIALRLLEPLNIPGVDFFSLQKGDEAEAQLRELKVLHWNGPMLVDFTQEFADFSDTAAFIDNLDLVISVDTSTAHLAAAMGKPVWLLNRFDTCWRWLLDRDDSPWYPTVTLFRQPSRGDWSNVVSAVRNRLVALG
jgi:tetratricopeptide (TPR) repeat protein